MIRPACLAFIAILLAGCARGEPTLYLWGSFPTQQYRYLLHEDLTVDEQIRELEALAEQAGAAHPILPAGFRTLPPGFRAHLGMLYLEAGNPQRTRELWLAEKAAFPESAPFIDGQLLGKLDAAITNGGK